MPFLSSPGSDVIIVSDDTRFLRRAGTIFLPGGGRVTNVDVICRMSVLRGGIMGLGLDSLRHISVLNGVRNSKLSHFGRILEVSGLNWMVLWEL